MVDAAHEKETRAKETIQSLKAEIANLSKLVEQGAGLTMGQEHSVNELLKVKEELTKERDEQLQEIVKLREQMAETENDQKKLEEAHEEAKQKIQEVFAVVFISLGRNVSIMSLLHSLIKFKHDYSCISTSFSFLQGYLV